MSMAVALGVRQVDKDRANCHSSSLEAILLAASTHQKIGCAMLGLVGFFMLLLMHGDAAPVLRPIGRLCQGKNQKTFHIFFPVFFGLSFFPLIYSCFEDIVKSKQI